MTSAMSLSAASTEFTAADGTHYAWSGLTVDRQNCTPTRIEFTDMSFINLGTGYVMVVPGTEGASITVTKSGQDPAVITGREPYSPTTLVQTVRNHGTGTVVVQGSGVQVNNFS